MAFEKYEIDLKGPQGNAFSLMAYAKKFAKQLDLDDDAILAEMKESDYNNLVKVFKKYFSEVADLRD